MVMKHIITAGLLLLAVTGETTAELRIRNHYSPKNSERSLRKSTRFIVLHTTEGSEAGSLRKVHKNGEAHYLVTQTGKIYRIIHRNRVAYHAGVSMWEGRTNLDNASIGIEVVGYHNGRLTVAQYDALRELIAELQRIYEIPDDHVLTHSMVAYGRPNRWHKRAHRGRKRCGMLFARPSARARLGITYWPAYDPDVRAKRLVVADSYLHAMLYGSAGSGGRRDSAARDPGGEDPMVVTASRSPWDIAGAAYNRSETRYRFPDGTEKAGDSIRNWKRIPAGTRVIIESEMKDSALGVAVIGQDAEDAVSIAGQGYNTSRTIYLMTDGRVRSGSELSEKALQSLPNQTRVLVGYVNGGYITSGRSAFEVCGAKWDSASTIYRLPDGALKQGNMIRARGIPRGTLVFFKPDA